MQSVSVPIEQSCGRLEMSIAVPTLCPHKPHCSSDCMHWILIQTSSGSERSAMFHFLNSTHPLQYKLHRRWYVFLYGSEVWCESLTKPFCCFETVALLKKINVFDDLYCYALIGFTLPTLFSTLLWNIIIWMCCE